MNQLIPSIVALLAICTLAAIQYDYVGIQGELISQNEVIRLEPVGDELKFATTEIKVKAGTELTIEFVNSAKVMPHTVVFLKSKDDIEAVGMAALTAHEHDYVPQDELNRIIAASVLVQPGETAEITFTVPPPGQYPYICTFPGHYTVMQGILISE